MNDINACFNNLLGGMDQLLSSLLIIMTLDLITKFFAPIPGEKHSIKSCYFLLWKKIIMLFTVVIANMADILVTSDFEFRKATIIYYIIVNTISFFQSAEKIEIIPRFLKDMFENLKNKTDKN